METTVLQSSRAAASQRGLAVSRVRHKGTSFVNTTTTVAEITAPNRSQGATPSVKFVPAKPAKVRAPTKPMTEEDLKRAQEGSNRRIVPKKQPHHCGDQDDLCDFALIPYHSAANGISDVSFSYQVVTAWCGVNEVETHSPLPPDQFRLPDWARHGLPIGLSDDGRECFHAYLFSCPIRHYPLEPAHLVSYQPLSRDQERFEHLFLDTSMLRCMLTMGALFLLLKSGKREPKGFAMHSAKLCAFVNKLLADKEYAVHKTIVVLESVATLALQATFLGLYDHWFAHVNGLKLLVQQAGGMEILPVPVQLLIKKADLKRVSEIVTMPLFEFGPLQQPSSNILPLAQQIVTATAVRRVVPEGEGYNDICDTMIALAIFVETIKFAKARRGEVVFDPLALMERYHLIEHRLLAVPGPIQSHSGALQRASGPRDNIHNYPQTQLIDKELEARSCLQILVRLAALFYLKMFKGGPVDTLDGLIHLLDLFYSYLRRITYLPPAATSSSIYGLPRSALIWIFFVADQIGRVSVYEGWNWGSQAIDYSVIRDFLHWVISEHGRDDINPINGGDLALYRILDLGGFQAGTWDPLAHIRRVLKSCEI